MKKLLKFLSNLTDIYSGNYHSTDPELVFMKKELMNISQIPTMADDKKALIFDKKHILGDINRAFIKYKSSKNGKTKKESSISS